MIRPPRISSATNPSGRSAYGLRRTAYGSRQLPHHVLVRLGAPVTVELPRAAHLLDHVEIHLGDHQLVFVLAALRQEVAARVDEVARAVELPDVPGRLGPHPV